MHTSWCLLIICLLGGGGTFAQSLPRLSPPVISGRVGENVTITCVVGTEETSSTILVTSDNQILPTINTQVQQDRVLFTYGPLTRNDNGLPVICQYAGMQATGSISVLFPPEYIIDDQSQEVIEGRSYVVTLSVIGNPLPTLEQTNWIFQSTPLQSDSEVTLGYNNLSFSSISRIHSGTYQVNSMTSAGTSNTLSFSINVLYPPLFSAGLGDIACADTPTQYSCAMRAGDNGTLNCGAVGNPAPFLTVNESSPQITADGDGVVVTDVRPADNEVTVYCVANNTLGTVQRSFTIYVGVPPVMPTGLTASVSNSQLTVTWVYSDPTNNVPLLQFLYSLRDNLQQEVDNGTVSADATRVDISLAGLIESTRYSIVLTAVNLLGSSPEAGTQFTTPDMIVVPVTSDVMVTDSSGLTRSCLLALLPAVCISLLLSP